MLFGSLAAEYTDLWFAAVNSESKALSGVLKLLKRKWIFHCQKFFYWSHQRSIFNSFSTLQDQYLGLTRSTGSYSNVTFSRLHVTKCWMSK